MENKMNMKFNKNEIKMVSEIVASLLVGMILAAAMSIVSPFILVKWTDGDFNPNFVNILWWLLVVGAGLVGFVLRLSRMK